jgi:hypothetical protein
MEKPGYKTTEFWLSLVALLVGALMASGILEASNSDWDNKIVGLVAMVLTSLGYTVGRSMTKGSSAKAKGLMDLASAAKEGGSSEDPS